jgi:hypothetical protein
MEGIAYYRFQTLPSTVRELNKIVSKKRLDCTHYYSNDYKGIEPFLNKEKQFFIQINDASNYVYKKISEDSISSRGLNLSSLIYDCENCSIAYGHPNKQVKLRNGKINPLRDFKNDGYIFIHNTEKTELELLVFPNMRDVIDSIYYDVLNGDLNCVINDYRDNAEVFYDYWTIDNTSPDLFSSL